MFALSPAQKLAMMAFAPRLQAAEELRERGGMLKPESLYDLALRAGLSRDEAETLHNERLAALLRAGEPAA